MWYTLGEAIWASPSGTQMPRKSYRYFLFLRGGIMATNNRKILTDASSNWVRVPFLVSFGNTFKATIDSMKFILGANENGVIKSDNSSGYQVTSTNALHYLGVDFYMQHPDILTQPTYSDTRCGGNDAINCIWQFNRDDDIVHPIHQTGPNGMGMGRVYAETTERNQTIAYFTFGVPVFANVVDFYTNAFDKQLITYNLTGGFSLLNGIGYLFNKAAQLLVLAIAFPFLSLKWVINLFQRSRNYSVDRFFDLRTTMHQYYRYVDSILSQWSVGVGFYGNNAAGLEDENGDRNEMLGLPQLMKQTGLSIFNIMALRGKLMAMRENRSVGDITYDWEADLIQMSKMTPKEFDNMLSNDNNMSGDYSTTTEWLYDYAKKNTTSANANIRMWNNNRVDFSEALVNSVFGATQFIGFRIEKSTDASESFSNSTGPSPLAEQLNEQARNNMVSFMDKGLGGAGTESHTGIGAIDAIADVGKNLMSAGANILDLGGLAEAVVGNAFIDIPESYRSSEFSKSHSLSFQLRAPYGDVISIYQSIMVPLALILASALPRAGGPWSYVQPFLCRVYVKGMFAIPLGIVDSISIKRGASEFGWTYRNLPTRIDVNMSIKDLSPLIYMAMADKTFPALLETNNSFKEYMLTLSGVGLHDRISRFENFKRNLQLWVTQFRHRILNPVYWASAFADTNLGAVIGTIGPFNRIARN